MIRIPDNDRFELRLADGATNPYLLQAAVIAAGLDGIAQQREPRAAAATTTCTPTRCRPRRPAASPPTCSTPCAPCARAKSWRTALGAPFVDAYAKLKEHEWNEHHAQISPWERQATLDC